MTDTPQQPPSSAPPPESSGGGDNRNLLLVILGAALVVVLVILIIVLINDDDDESSSTSAGSGDTTTTAAGGGETTTTAGGGTLPPGDHQYTLTIPAGTVLYSGSCNVEEDTLSAQGQGAQNETISITAQVTAQTGGVSIAALGLEGEGTINAVTVGEGTFSVSGSGSVSDDSVDESFDFSVQGSCTTG